MRLLATISATAICIAPSFCFGGELLPTSFATLVKDFKGPLAKLGIKDVLAQRSCTDPTDKKRTVCSYAFGDYMTVMASTDVGKKDVSSVVFICGSQSIDKQAKCLATAFAAMEVLAPDVPKQNRPEIYNVLLKGLQYGNSTEIKTDETRLLLQKSVGLWFHVIAASSRDGQAD